MDGVCQECRAEALIAIFGTKVCFATDEEYRVLAGSWNDSLSGNMIQNSRDIDIAHEVPLKWVMARGGGGWASAK